MKAYFRAVVREDIPHIKKFVREIGDEDDYVPKFIEQWFLEGDTVQIGVFPSIQMRSPEIVGFGQLRSFPNGVGWLEAGRISPQVQQQDLGTQLVKYLVNYAFSHGVKVVQYNTWTTRDFMDDRSKEQTHGSIRIAKRLGFHVKDYVDVLSAKGSELILPVIPNPSDQFHKLTQISSLDAYNKLRQILKPLPAEICHGWGYFLPCIPEIINNVGDHVTWIAYGEALAQFIHFDPNLVRESPIENELWIVIYGDSNDASELLIRHLISYSNPKLKSLENISVFCPHHLSPAIIQLGFNYYTEIPSGDALFEKYRE
ncbi:MAG: GNAT family N-acetyltransferase [Promethearchaeota archaeon]